jgi:hypothetical protein
MSGTVSKTRVAIALASSLVLRGVELFARATSSSNPMMVRALILAIALDRMELTTRNDLNNAF